MPLTQDRFLSNNDSKVGLSKFLSLHLQEEGISIINSPGDANSTIVETALEIAQKNLGPVTVVSDDTDIVVMLVYHWQENMSEVYFLQERWSTMPVQEMRSSKSICCFSIHGQSVTPHRQCLVKESPNWLKL